MKAKLKLLQVVLVAIILAVLALVAYVCYTFERSFGFVLFSFGLMCMVMLFHVGGMVGDKKVSLRSKLTVFCLGVVLIITGILLILSGF